MGRLLFWVLGIIAAVLLVRRWRTGLSSAPKPAPELNSVRCQRCGVFIPRPEALLVDGFYYCQSRGCRVQKT